MGCRCVPCRAAYAKYWNEGHRRRQQGIRKDCVPSDWAREHIKDRNKKELAKQSGIGRATLVRIMQGKMITEETERMVLAA